MDITHAPRGARLGALAALSGLVLSTLVGIPAAHADNTPVFDYTVTNSAYPYHLDPANAISGYTLTATPTSRTGEVGGSSALKWGPGRITIDTGCPVGYRASSRQFVVTQDGVETGVQSSLVAGPAVTTYGFHDGETITYAAGADTPNFEYMNQTTLPTGVNAVVFTCDPHDADGNYIDVDGTSIGNSKYFVLWLKVDRAAETWSVTTDPRSAALTATTTTLAASGVTVAAATLTATVAPAAATGTVQFKQAGVAIGSPVAVANGTASYSVSGLSASTTYGFTAEYSGDTTYAASASASTSVTTVAAAADSSNSSVNVTVPTVTPTTPTGLKISVKPGSTIALTGAATRTQGAAWSATGSLGNVTVNDDRRVAGAAWTLSGQSSAFTSGSNTVAASNLGWTPAKVSGVGGTAGAAATGLDSSQPLATGTGTTDANVTTVVSAGLTLAVPADSAAGDYTATLTLTLI